MTIRIGVLGGTGLYQMENFDVLEERRIETPFGDPSDALIIGELAGLPLVFLPRHGRGHRLFPADVNARANIYALKSLGVERLISVNAVGSLRADMAPRDFVVPDQMVDFTKHRVSTFFGDGLAAHVSMADPFCPVLCDVLSKAAAEAGRNVHGRGTYICMEGPQFSSKAESEMYRQLGFDVIGMTVAPEAKLAREAEICYASLSCVTDYDCWHEEEEAVTTERILDILRGNVEAAQSTVQKAVQRLPKSRDTCSCSLALQYAIATHPDAIPPERRKALGLLIGPHLGDGAQE